MNKRVRSGLGLENEERPGQPKKYEDAELEGLLDPNTRGAGRNVRSDSIIHFVAFESHWNDSEARKLCAVSTEAERRRAPIVHL